MSKFNGLKQKRILLVEDVELNQFLARHIMESWGCVVEVAENGRRAVEKIRDADYDLVLMDIQMPEMDGMEATKAIRSMEHQHKSSVPIVALTANALKSECETYMKIGMNDWLAKPFEEPALYQTVSKNIKRESAMNTSPANAEMKKENGPAVATKLYNLAMVEAISGGDTTFVERMLALFLETVPATLQDLNSTAEKGDWEMVSKHAHKLKSTIDSMGICEVKQDIRAIEAGGKNGGDPAVLTDLVRRVDDVMKLVMRQVRSDWKL